LAADDVLMFNAMQLLDQNAGALVLLIAAEGVAPFRRHSRQEMQ
jgi:hypothetical protein